MNAMTIEEITARICAFRDARDWMQFHNPKELAIAIAAEAGELMQPFVWKSHEQSDAIMVEKHEAIREEVADVAMLLFEFAHNAGISVEEAILDKLAKNEQRYSVEKARGSNAKYDEL
jgi:dCTP diphosphatase